MRLELFLNILTVLEIIGVEFLSIWLLSQRRHRFVWALGLYAVITAVLIAFMCLVAVHLPGYGTGSGKFMLLGVVYFIPALVNYGGGWKNRLILAFFSFSYGLAGFCLAVRIGYLFPAPFLTGAVLAVQTVLFAVTFPFYLRFARKSMLPYMQKAGPRQKNLLIQYTITSFFLIVLYNSTMVDSFPFKQFLVYLLLIYFIILTYKLLVSYLKADGDNQTLSALATTDQLTGLGNRIALRDKTEMLLTEKTPFSLFFMDLDCFKKINDDYGHRMGDAYLVRFAAALREAADGRADFFRFSGDEFVCISRDARILTALREIDFSLPGAGAFQGVSIGAASFPQDAQTLSDLIDHADQNMYLEKKQKKHGYIPG
ncbi:MAG: GGDEF domain-containing protein [Oscillospiraceae bacterium]|nr:GGDEF domain-containing protein [Oscillospiraceae bacterium]